MPLRSTFTRFFQLEAASGLLLIAAAALALIVNNSPLSHYYTAFLDVPVAVQIGALQIAKPSLLWINDGLMALFFLLIGLEVKREVLEGQLRQPAQLVLPGAAAIGGMLVVFCLEPVTQILLAPFMFVAVAYGIFTVPRRTLLVLTAAVLCAYAAVIAAHHAEQGNDALLRLELMHLLALASPIFFQLDRKSVV